MAELTDEEIGQQLVRVVDAAVLIADTFARYVDAFERQIAVAENAWAEQTTAMRKMADGD